MDNSTSSSEGLNDRLIVCKSAITGNSLIKTFVLVIELILLPILVTIFKISQYYVQQLLDNTGMGKTGLNLGSIFWTLPVVQKFLRNTLPELLQSAAQL